ncbi:LTA synthase family protein [Radiobacillus sp. PE A8.2]|uniref:LTA synthase family protein n=1 Tax=Radiobacillus sp. PE A8.2 TaxID=3380349 RepID=UPI00388E7555
MHNNNIKNNPLFVLGSILFGIKTYIIYRFLFDIELDNFMQELILLINPFVSSFLFFSLSVWYKKHSQQMKFIRYSSLIGTIILYINLVFYRSFTDFITIPQLFQLDNMGDLGSSIFSLIRLYDLILIVDVVVIWYLSGKKQHTMSVDYSKRKKRMTLALSLLLLIGNFILAEIERPQLFTRAFDREYLVKNIGLFNYHIYDLALNTKVKTQRVFADDNQLTEIKEYVNNKQSDVQSELFGLAKGKNLIFISAESLQNFVINNKVNGKEITPFLNSLVEDEDTFYFNNFYHQAMQGKTSDSEFLAENSLYPLPRGAAFFTHSQNEYNALPEILKEKANYSSAVFHANNKSFWNRDEMYKSLGYDRYYGEQAFQITEENSIGWGLKDKPFFEQSIKYLQSKSQPFYTKFITLTNHFPYELNEEDRSIEPYDSNSQTLNNYFPTVRYTDEAIEQFFAQLKDAGLYENSIIVIMGDHYGISENHNKAMSQYLGKDQITPYDHVQLQRVPLFIHVPGSGKGEVISRVAGQIDIKPTLLSLMGIKNERDIYFGNNLFINDRKGFVALRNGDFISENYLYTEGVCYDRQSGETIVDKNDLDNETENPCGPIQEKILKELSYSDEIVYGDLFRYANFMK